MVIGDSYYEVILITEDHVNQFAKLSGDFNPIHFDDNIASNFGFKGKIVHGMILGSFISKILASSFPGPGTIYLNQELLFKSPVYIGDELKFKFEVLSRKESKPIYTIKTEVFNQRNEQVLDGKAVVLSKKL